MDDYTSFKRCTQCGETFPATTEHFYVDRSCKAGLTPQCRACRKAAWAKNADKYNEKSRAKWAANRDEINARKREQRAARGEEYRAVKRKWKQANRDRLNARARQQYAEDPEKFKQRADKWKAANPDKVSEKQRRYRKENADKVRSWARVNQHKRNARKAELPNTFTWEDWQKCLDHFGGRCAVCNCPPDLFHALEMDHWIPLSSKECPGTTPENMIPLCISCNSGKRDRKAEEWIVEKFGRRKGKTIINRIVAYLVAM